MKQFFQKQFSKEGLLKIFHSFVWIPFLVFAVDIISKWIIQNTYPSGGGVTLIPNFLHITLVHNLGASFGMGSSGTLGWRIFWIAISVILTAVLVYIFVRYSKKFSNLQKIALSLMIGGAFGNMIDRIFYWKSLVGFDGVIDWIDFQFGNWHFATFNIADSCLVIGVLIIIVIEIITVIKDTKEKAKSGAYDLPPAEFEAKQKEDAKDKNKQ